jgi:hypothetical protein
MSLAIQLVVRHGKTLIENIIGIQNPRNISLGLAIDGFNPFGTMSSSYSMWSVFAILYNFPLWVCMEQSNFMMCLLIPSR